MSYQSRIVYQSTVIGVRPWGRGRDRAEITRASRGRLGPYPRIPACEARHWHISSARDRPKGPSRRARRPAAHRLKKNPAAVAAPKTTFALPRLSERVAVATEPALLEAVDSRALGAPVGRSSVHPRLHERYAPEQPGARAPHLNSCRATR